MYCQQLFHLAALSPAITLAAVWLLYWPRLCAADEVAVAAVVPAYVAAEQLVRLAES